MGMTGFATGKHLHWEIWAGHIKAQPMAGFHNGKGYYDPMTFCKAVIAFEKANVEALKETPEDATVTVAPSHSVPEIPTVAVPTEAKIAKAPVVAKTPVVAKPVVAKVAYPGHYLKVGSKDVEVKYLQTKLKVNPTGLFDLPTEKAVKALQSKHGLLVDGVVGPKTWAKLG
jgi:peptidoglycan hydrolase-like protein with peptidoglycan-binding domain